MKEVARHVRRSKFPLMNDLPSGFEKALSAAGLSAFFAECTHAHRKEYLRWIGEAKRDETRKDRIGKAVKMLAEKCAAENARAKKKQR
jgi:uncharacterized protein YdeI (YjbR/CyaY-like superfamily)